MQNAGIQHQLGIYKLYDGQLLTILALMGRQIALQYIVYSIPCNVITLQEFFAKTNIRDWVTSNKKSYKY